MRLFIATDIHGSYYYAKMLVERAKQEKADKIILLGDIYYHGPRNPLPQGYDPMRVAELLNSLDAPLMVIKGNCDAEVDQMVSDFKFLDTQSVENNGYKVIFTHGHKYNKDNLPQGEYDYLVHGHTHINEVTKVGEATVINISSVSLPKENNERAYLIMDKAVEIKNLLTGGTIHRI